MRHKKLSIVFILAAVFLATYGTVSAVTTFVPQQGGTGTTSPSGILYGSNSGSTPLQTVTLGANCTFVGGTLNCTSSGGAGTGTISTSTGAVIPNLLYFSGLSTVANVATTSHAFSGPFTTTGTIGALVGGSNSTITWSGLATTSQPASSNLLVSNGGAGVYAVATSTLTASGPLTGSFTQVGAGGSLGCTTAASGVAGCLSNTAFDLFNLKQAAGFQIATTSGIAISQLAYYTNTGTTIGGVATTSETCSSPLSCTAHAVLGGGGAISLGTVGYANGGTGTTTAPISQLLYGGATGYQSVATTTVSCTGSTTCTSFTALGSSPITISSSGVGSGLATTSPTASSNLLVYSAVGAGAAYGIATTTFTPSAEFTVGGTIGTLVGGANSTLALATNGIALTKLAQIAANSILGNSTGGTANVTALATSSLGIAISDTTGTLAILRGGTGQTTKTAAFDALSPLTTTGDLLVGGLSGTGIRLALGTPGYVLASSGGTAAWVATSSISGPWTTSGNNIYNSNTANVGIGTTTPFGRLSVSSTGQLAAATSLFNIASTSNASFFNVDASGNVSVQSTTATSTFSGDVAIGSAGVAPNPYLFMGTSTGRTPIFGRVQGDLIDAEYSYNGQTSINVVNGSSGSCASATFFADGNNPTLGGYYGTFSFLNDGWTGVGCGIGAGTGQKALAVVAANPTGEMDFVIASTTNNGFADFNWFTNTNTLKMKLTNAGNLGLGTTTPWAKFSALLGDDFTAKAPSYAIAIASSTAGTATTTLFTVESSGKVSAPIELNIPNGSTKPTQKSAGDVFAQTNTASSSIEWYDGTNWFAVYDTFDKPTVYASSTLAYDGGYAATGTTTYRNIWNPSQAVTSTQIYCKTDTGTAIYTVGNGAATSTVTCTTSGAVNVASVAFTLRQNVVEAIGSQTGSPNQITVTPTFRYNSY